MTADNSDRSELIAKIEALRDRVRSLERLNTKRRKAERGLRGARAAFRDVVEGSEDGFIILDSSGLVRFVNRAAGFYLGQEPAALLDQPFEAPEPSDPPAEIGIARADGGAGVGEIRVRATVWDGTGARLVSLRDITERKDAEKRLRHEALHDTLTGLPNRGLFMERLNHALRRARRRRDYLFSVVFLDVDRFKVINDSLGHLVGDRLLVEMGRRIQECLRDLDTVARIGGDEFAILLEDIGNVSDATRVAGRIQEELNTRFDLMNHEVYSSVSMGIAMSSTGYDRPEDVLRDADSAMYHAKERGKARFELFDQEMYERAMMRLRTETDLRRALDRDEFRLFYQPIVDLATGKLSGFEALIRWQHPERGMVQPLDFLPMAEEMDLMLPLSRWVLREACRQALLWQSEFTDAAPVSVSVNLSPRMFGRPDLAQQVGEALKETGLDGRRLSLEITEGALLDHADDVTVSLFDLRLMGVQLHMDDFGTGYSSLSYLHKFPLDTLKIDRSFISGLSRRSDTAEIVRSIVLLAGSLDMAVIAEGVETASQLERIKDLNCEYAQGFLFARPLDADAVRDIIVKHTRF